MRPRLNAAFAAVLLSAALWGCTSDGRPADAASFDASFDANQEVPADVGLTRFLLRNASARSIFIQTSTFSGPGYWGLSRAGTSLPVINTCEVCDCPMCPNCAVCGRAFAKVKEITPGAVFDFSWDGRLWRLVSRTCGGGGMCEMPETVAPGPLSVQVQYGHSFKIDTSAGADDEWVDQPLLMTTKVFTHPSPQVEIVVGP